MWPSSEACGGCAACLVKHGGVWASRFDRRGGCSGSTFGLPSRHDGIGEREGGRDSVEDGGEIANRVPLNVHAGEVRRRAGLPVHRVCAAPCLAEDDFR